MRTHVSVRRSSTAVRRSLLTLAAVLASTASARPAVAQTSPAAGPAPAAETLAVVTADDVYVRSGAGDSYYPFGKLQRGAIVRVLGEKHGWSRVATEGPAFAKLFGYVKHPMVETNHVRLENGGRSIRALKRVDLLAPNMNVDYRPADSWKRLLPIDRDRVLTVLGTTEDERDLIYTVRLPVDATGWVSAAFLQPASREQVAAWKAARDATARTTTDAARGANARPRPDEARASGVLPGERPASQATAGTDAARTPGVLGRVEPLVAPNVTRPATADPASARPAATAPLNTRPAGAAARTPSGARDAAPASAAPSSSAIPPARAVTPPPATRTVADPTPAAPSAKAASSPRKRLEDLESAFTRLRDEPIASAEVLPLRQLYVRLVDELDDNAAVEQFASARVEQLTIWADLQKRRAELGKLRKRIELSTEEAESLREALDSTGVYVAAGRLAPSQVYGGGRLPQLYRVQDARTGYTIGYLEPDERFALEGLVGQIVGVVGTKRHDATRRLNMLEPRRIDLLTSASGH